ncbi:MAG: hypothetical protein B1H07_00115 [Campylobacteraceae bacterium 4484_166]|nr:MAG: hypothetical protein B1H07_00115 [Campylobacteraceae bacterium 4484_166]
METQTIDKLQEALEKLLVAYEELQAQNNNLNDDIRSLKDQNSELADKLSMYEKDNDDKSNAMDDMLDKIETVLEEDENRPSANRFETKESDEDRLSVDADDESIVNANTSKKDEQKTEKLQLNKLDNLMEGFL